MLKLDYSLRGEKTFSQINMVNIFLVLKIETELLKFNFKYSERLNAMGSSQLGFYPSCQH